MNERQHDSSYQLLAMDPSPQLPPGTNYTKSTIVPHSRCQNRTSGIHDPGRLPGERRAPLFGDDRHRLNWTGRFQILPMCSNACITIDPVPTTAFLPYQLRRATHWTGVIWINGSMIHESSTTLVGGPFMLNCSRTRSYRPIFDACYLADHFGS